LLLVAETSLTEKNYAKVQKYEFEYDRRVWFTVSHDRVAVDETRETAGEPSFRSPILHATASHGN